MFRKFLSGRSLAFGAALLLSLVLTSCLKDDDDMDQPKASALMAFNLAPDQSSLGVSLSGSLLTGTYLSFGSYTGRYLNIFPGNRMVESFNAQTSALLDSTSFVFQPERYYSLFVIGAENDYSNIIVEDNYDSLSASSGKSYVRYINALSNAPGSAVKISSGGVDLVNGNAAFGEVSGFMEVEPGEVSVEVSNGEASASRDLSIEQQKAYTILLIGLPNQSDSSKAVQIRYIENGTVTD